MSLIPKHRIPKLYPTCMDTTCGGVTKAQFGTPHAAGYYRRHVCLNCGRGFYSLAPYVGEAGDIYYSEATFKDRALTELEEHKRKLWWDEADNAETALNVVPLDIPAAMRQALLKSEADRSEVDHILVATHGRLLEYLTQQSQED